ncbi:MAG: PAS domain S-box protein [Anaerolineae bacterium]|nr:PAS domain S-box protein [Anaerolineae bacterium]
MRIRYRVLLILLGFLSLVMLGFAGALYYVQYTALQSGMDHELLTAAYMVDQLLPPGYHNQIKNESEIDENWKANFTARLSQLCLQTDIDYLWSVLTLDGQLIYTSTSDDSGKFDVLTQLYADNDAYASVFERSEAYYGTWHDQKGDVRIVLIPFKDAMGRIYVVGAGQEMGKFKTLTNGTLLSSIGIGLAVLLLGILASWELSRSLAMPIEKVTKTAGRIAAGEQVEPLNMRGTKELEQLGESINQMDRAIRERGQRLNEVLENAAVALYKRNYLTNVYEYMSPAITRITGYTVEEMICKSVEEVNDLVHPDDITWVIEESDKVVNSGGGLVVLEYRIFQKNGQIRWVSDSCRIFVDKNHKRVYSIGSVQDVTESKQTQIDLQKSENLYRLLTDNMKDVVWILDAETGYFRYVSPSVMDLRGYSVEDVMALPAMEAISSNARDEITRSIQIGVDEFKTSHKINPSFSISEVPQPHKDGSIVWTEVITRYVINEESGHLEIYGVTRDINQRKKTEEALRESEQQFRLLTEALPLGIVVAQQDGTNLYLNQSFTRLFGYSKEDVPTVDDWWPLAYPDEKYRELVQKGWKERLECCLNRASDFESMDAVVACKDGSQRYIEFRVTLMDDNLLIVFSDQTDRKRTEDALHSSEQRFRSLFDNMAEGVALHEIIYDQNQRAVNYKIIDTNHQYEIVLNLRREMVINRLATDIYGADGEPPYLKEYSWVTETGVPYHFETYFPPMNKYFYISVTKMGEKQFATIFFDITDTKQKETEVKHLSSFPGLNPNPVLEINRDGHVIYFNRASQELAKQIGQQDVSVFVPHDFKEIMASLEASEEKTIHREVELGEYLFAESFSYGPESDTVRLYSVDITERRRVEEALRDSRDRLVRAEMVALSGNWEITLDSNEIRGSEGAARIYGMEGEEWPLEMAQQVPLPEYRSELDTALKELITNGTSYDLEFKIQRQNDGAIRYVHSVARFDSQRRVIFGVIQDITDRKQAEEEVRRLNANLERLVKERTTQLETSNRELEAFAYSVSHDLRAPLRSIDGFSQALMEEAADRLDENQNDYLMRVRAAARRMGLLIDNLLKLSRVTRSEMVFSRVELSALVKKLAGELQELQPESRRIEWVLTPDIVVYGDEKLLEVALSNLLSNACKFTSLQDVARIEFGLTSQNGKPVYFVRDNGVGFDMNYADKLFGVFQRLHSAAIFEGTGIGLATVQRIIQRHGGQVWAEAEPEKGATFYFTLDTRAL